MNTITPLHAVELTLDELAYRLSRAKQREAEAKEERLDLEELIVSKVGAKKEGSFTAKGDMFSLTTTGKLTRTIDLDKLPEVQEQIPTPLFERLFNYKPSLNTKELKYIEMNEPEYYDIVAKALTTKPAKTAVAFKELENK